MHPVSPLPATISSNFRYGQTQQPPPAHQCVWYLNIQSVQNKNQWGDSVTSYLQVMGVLPILPLLFPVMWVLVNAFGEARVLAEFSRVSPAGLVSGDVQKYTEFWLCDVHWQKRQLRLLTQRSVSCVWANTYMHTHSLTHWLTYLLTFRVRLISWFESTQHCSVRLRCHC